jgi:hypothetical protein
MIIAPGSKAIKTPVTVIPATAAMTVTILALGPCAATTLGFFTV